MKHSSWCYGHLLFGALLLFAPSAPALVGNHSSSDAHRGSIVGLQMNGQLFCSGAFLSPRLILTAGHCVTGTNLFALLGEKSFQQKGRSISQITLRFAPQTEFDSHRDVPAVLANIHIHPKWPRRTLPSQRDISIYSDLAILELSEDMADAVPFPVDFSPTRIAETLVATGQGLSDADCRDEATGGALRSAPMEVEKFRFHDFGLHRRDLTSTETPAHYCPGDSGGPVLRYNEIQGTYSIIGVNSFSEKRLWLWGSDTDWAVRLDLDVNRQWISEIMAHEE